MIAVEITDVPLLTLNSSQEEDVSPAVTKKDDMKQIKNLIETTDGYIVCHTTWYFDGCNK